MQGSMLDKYAFGAHAIMLVYDVTNGASFDQLAGNIEFIQLDSYNDTHETYVNPCWVYTPL